MSDETSNKDSSELSNPEVGSEPPFDPKFKRFISEYNNDYKYLNEEKKLQTFRNVIRAGEKCGFQGDGYMQYLINTDSRNKYRVTYRILWRRGIEFGHTDRSIVMKAGAIRKLTCSDFRDFPLLNFNYLVIAEVVI